MDSRPSLLLRIAVAISRRPLLTLALLALALAPLLVASAGLRPNNSLDAWFVEGDPALAAYHEFLRDYGNDEAILVGFDTPGGARSTTELQVQRRLASRLVAIDGIARVIAGGELPAAAARGLVAEDEGAAAIVAWVAVRPDLEQERGRIVAEAGEAARAELEPLGRTPHLVGNGVLYEGLNQQTIRDTAVFISLALVAMMVLLAIGLRSWRAVVLALVPPLLASGAGLGVLALAGRPFTIVGSALPTLILVIALTDSIHVLLHYGQARRASPPADAIARRRQAAESVGWVAVPCLFTSITTAAGFLALATSRIALVRDFGIFAAVGMLLAGIVTLVLLAAALSLWDVVPGPTRPTPGPVHRSLDAISRALPRLRWPIVATAVLAAAVLGVGATRLEADTHTIGLLPEGHVVRRDSDWFEQRLGSYTPLEMRITASGSVRDGTFRERLAAWRVRAESLPEVQRTFSGGDLVAPDVERVHGYESPDGQSVRVTAYVPMSSARGLARAAASLEREGRAVFSATERIEASGYLPLYVRITEYVVRSTISGLTVAFILVFIVMALLIRSRRGLVAAAPVNLLPVLLVFGVMGWSGIPLDIATATVGAIVLGIVVDDTIHFLYRFREEQRSGATDAAAAAGAVRHAGPGMVLTSAVLASGFAVMIAAGTKSIAYFGLVATLAVVGALAADLLLLPALLGGPAAAALARAEVRSHE